MFHILFDLFCSHHHLNAGWSASEAQEQQGFMEFHMDLQSKQENWKGEPQCIHMSGVAFFELFDGFGSTTWR